ncbi:MAG: hypothetical protein M1826_004783 [Phylliscum demangeonii]|nr:MAG: hypothetical protein M1826_004783 [Phylliscum demangeonii]
MHSFSPLINVAVLLALVFQGSASPVPIDAVSLLVPGAHDFVDCSKEEKGVIIEALGDMGKLAAHAVDTLIHTDWKKNNGFTHYFTEGDHEHAVKAFGALTINADTLFGYPAVVLCIVYDSDWSRLCIV